MHPMRILNMHPMRILNMHSNENTQGGRGGCFLPPTSNVFPLSFQLQFLKMFPIAPHFYPILSFTYIYIYMNHKGGPKEEAPLYFYFGEWVKMLIFKLFFFESYNIKKNLHNTI
jgi:hypothetical protein